MKNFLLVVLVLALAVGGLEMASLWERNKGLQSALDEQMKSHEKAAEKWAQERENLEAEKAELLKKAQITQLENDALHMENENLLARLQPEIPVSNPVTELFQAWAEKIKID